MSSSQFYLEFFQLAGQVKVSAIDPDTGIEVSIVASTSASKDEMTRIAVNKLKRRIKRDATTGQNEDDQSRSSINNDDDRGGILI